MERRREAENCRHKKGTTTLKDRIFCAQWTTETNLHLNTSSEYVKPFIYVATTAVLTKE